MTPPRPPTVGLPAMHDVKAVHDLTALHDLAAVHDASRSHDTTRTHDTTRIHDTQPRTRPGPPVQPWAQPTPAPPERRRSSPSARWRDLIRRRGASLVVVVMLLDVVIVGAGLIAASRTTTAAGETSGSPRPTAERALSDRALRWLRDNTTAGSTVSVPLPLLSRVSAALPGRTVLSPSAVGDRQIDLVLAQPVGQGRTPAEREALANSIPVGTLSARLDLRQVLPVGTSWELEVASQRDAGQELAGNPALTLSGPARAVIASGQLDSRLLLLLSGLLSEHRLTIDVPASDAFSAAGATTRSLRITGVDGRRLIGDEQAVRVLTESLSHAGAGPGSRATSATNALARGALVVRYGAPTPPGLLSAGPATP